MMQKLTSLLQKAGLSEAETVLYTELLKEPAATKWELVGRTKMSKSAVYRAFERLEQLKMIKKIEQGYKAGSLKALVAELYRQRRKKGKLAEKIEAMAPYLHMPTETIQDIQILFTEDQVAEAYINNASQDFDISLDFGDLENFAPTIGGLERMKACQKIRAKHAKADSLMTSVGPCFEYFSTKASREIYHNKMRKCPVDYKYQLVDFNSDNDNVIFSQFLPGRDPVAVAVTSKVIADFQRAQFKLFAQLTG